MTAWRKKGEIFMDGQVCMITGANSGIGKATALSLARMSMTVVLVCRNLNKGEAAQAEIQAASGNPNIDLLLVDLSSQAEVRRSVQEFKSRYTHLRVLINNAGVALNKRQVTQDGIETVFAVNYLAPFLLTTMMLDMLKASAPARVVNVAGDYHRKAMINFDDLMSEKDYNGMRANNQSKLAMVLFTYELARRLVGTGVTVNCLHPGAVATGGPLKDPDLSKVGRSMYRLVKPFFLSPEKGAETSVYLASSPEVEGVTGKYFVRNRTGASSPESYDLEVARRLWKISVQLTGGIS